MQKTGAGPGSTGIDNAGDRRRLGWMASRKGRRRNFHQPRAVARHVVNLFAAARSCSREGRAAPRIRPVG